DSYQRRAWTIRHSFHEASSRLSVGSSDERVQPTNERRKAYAEREAGSIFAACAHVATDHVDGGAASMQHRAGAAVPATLEAASAKSGSSGKADYYSGTGENGHGRPHSLRQPKAGHESAQEPGWRNHGAGRNEIRRAGRQ